MLLLKTNALPLVIGATTLERLIRLWEIEANRLNKDTIGHGLGHNPLAAKGIEDEKLEDNKENKMWTRSQ